MPEALARTQEVGRTFGRGPGAVVAVHGATVTVGPRDRTAIVGPSGSGKSTLLHLLAGLEEPTTGSVEWPALSATPRDDIGLVFQAPSLVPGLDVLENVELPLLLHGLDRAGARERARESLTRLGLDGLRAALPQELSGGQAQRIVIARVLASAPRLVLADEPTSRLDRATADHVIDVLLEASDRSGAALVIATHDPHISERMGRVWPMTDGRPQAAVEAAAT